VTDSPDLAARFPANPLYRDRELFAMYMRALDEALAYSEIRGALDEFGLSAATVRMKMVSSAREVLGTAAKEFARYERALADSDAARISHGQITHGSQSDLESLVRLAWIGTAAAGGILIVLGATIPAAWAAVWPGGALLLAALMLLGARLALGPDLSVGENELGMEMSPVLMQARDRLMAAVSRTELLAQIRTLINTARQGRFDHAYYVTGSPGLSEVYDSINTVPTGVEAEFERLLGRLAGGSIGVAGPRGSGKSTLIRGYCEEAAAEANDPGSQLLLAPLAPEREQGDLRCLVAAPVDYVSRDFVLHLFAMFCRTVISRYARRRRDPDIPVSVSWLISVPSLAASLFWRAVLFGGGAVALWHWQRAVAHWAGIHQVWIRYAAAAIVGAGALDFLRVVYTRANSLRWEPHSSDEEAFAAAAQDHLARVRYLQTFTSGWSGTLSLPSGGAGATHTRTIARSEQPLGYPEIVDEFRKFAAWVARDVHRQGNRVFVGVDELDKIGSAEQAEKFLNEIKGIFGIPHLYFMVSVSDDALTAFERRGLPLRDAFDSSFDEIVNVAPLTYAESRRLLYRRVVGLSEPYVALSHCLAGGLARDVIRAARQIVRIAAALAPGSPPLGFSDIEEVGDSADYFMVRWRLYLDPVLRSLPTLSAIATALVQDELHRKIRAVSHVLRGLTAEKTTDFQELLHDTAHGAKRELDALGLVDVLGKPPRDEPPKIAALRLDLAAYAYYCATLQEIFTDHLGRKRMVQASGESAGPGGFDALAAARNAFSVDTLLAWRSTSQFRKAWSLETREPG
jgi:hypothetical protein